MIQIGFVSSGRETSYIEVKRKNNNTKHVTDSLKKIKLFCYGKNILRITYIRGFTSNIMPS